MGKNHATVPWFQSDTKHRPTIIQCRPTISTFALQFRPLHLLDLQKMKITISLDVFERFEHILASLSIESWLFNRDPYVMAYYILL